MLGVFSSDYVPRHSTGNSLNIVYFWVIGEDQTSNDGKFVVCGTHEGEVSLIFSVTAEFIIDFYIVN